MTKFLIAALLVLRFLAGNAQVGEEVEDIDEFLRDYASYISDYLYSTIEYYSDNTTLVPTMYTMYTMYTYEEFEESMGSSLRCHLPLVVTLGLLLPFLL